MPAVSLANARVALTLGESSPTNPAGARAAAREVHRRVETDMGFGFRERFALHESGSDGEYGSSSPFANGKPTAHTRGDHGSPLHGLAIRPA